LEVTVHQNTVSDADGIQKNISLDIRCGYNFRIDSIEDNGSYCVTVRYKNLSISMIAPEMKISLNPETPSGKILQEYIDLLENRKWNMILSRAGEVKSISGLSGIFHEMYNESSASGQQDVIIKTLDEAFGEESFLSFSNMILHLYPDYPVIEKWVTRNRHFFNTKEVSLSNKWYYTYNKDGQQLVQGIGIIESPVSDTIEYNGISITTSVEGSQTYDYITNPETGWMLAGLSRQKIIVINKIVNDPSFPEGLEIPTLTETSYLIKDKTVKAEEPVTKNKGRRNRKTDR